MNFPINPKEQFVETVVERVELRPDVARAVRATIAFALALILAYRLGRSLDGPFISMAALNLSLTDVRGSYGSRLVVLFSQATIALLSAVLGVVCGAHPAGASLAMFALALLGGLWRHLSLEYGGTVAIASALMFLVGLSQPGHWSDALRLGSSVALGSAIAILFQVWGWLVRPEHPLRAAVSESWISAANLAAAMAEAATQGHAVVQADLARQERILRESLDATFLVLGKVKDSRRQGLIAHLEEMRRQVVHLTMRLIALSGAMEGIQAEQNRPSLMAGFRAVFLTIADSSRSVALSLILHRGEQDGPTAIRLKHCAYVIETLREQISEGGLAGGAVLRVLAALDQLASVLPRIQAELAKTPRSRPSGSLWTGWPNLSSISRSSVKFWVGATGQFDPVLARYALRMSVFTTVAVAIYKFGNIPRGYWAAFTIFVVLQPDYGSTRQKAGARIGGTLAGAVAGSGLLWLHFPAFLLHVFSTLTAGCFAYWLKQRYWVAIFFVTVNLVLVVESVMTVSQEFLLWRVGATLAGGLLALIAARVFWPTWEGAKFSSLLAKAIRDNARFLGVLMRTEFPNGEPGRNLLLARRHAENANRYAAASLERLSSEPGVTAAQVARAAALCAGNQRLISLFTGQALLLSAAAASQRGHWREIASQILVMLDSLALCVESSGLQKTNPKGFPTASAQESMSLQNASFAGESDAISAQTVQILGEVRAMQLALESTTKGSTSEPAESGKTASLPAMP